MWELKSVKAVVKNERQNIMWVVKCRVNLQPKRLNELLDDGKETRRLFSKRWAGEYDLSGKHGSRLCTKQLSCEEIKERIKQKSSQQVEH
jgi:hypothetical protein